MFCQQCGKEIPAESPTCPACGFSTIPPGLAHSTPPSSVDELVSEVKRAAEDLTRAAASLSQRVVEKANRAAKDPSGSAKRATRRVAQELDNAAKEIDRILRNL